MPAPVAPSVGPLSVLRRLGRALSPGWLLRPVTSTATRQVQLQALAGILDDAVAAQPAADRAVAACGGADPWGALTTREAAAQITAYHHLIVRLRALRLASDLLPLGERASRLLAHHEWILNLALTLVRAPRCDARSETARQRLNGLGSAADDLRALRDDVRALADRTCGEAERPCGEGAPQ